MCAIFVMMFYHVPKRLNQLFCALRANILMSYESVPMYSLGSVPLNLSLAM